MAIIRVGTTANNLAPISPDPSACEWGLQDISAADAGRVQTGDNRMYKMRTSQKRKLKLTWTLVTESQASAILQAFNDEYFYVSYPDALLGRTDVREFYAGDRTAPLRWYNLPRKGTRYANLSFDIIER